jgi:hypothetical protein
MKIKCEHCGHTHECTKQQEYGKCKCGKHTVKYTLDKNHLFYRTFSEHRSHDGWIHSKDECVPPPENSVRCYCRYCILRPEWKYFTYNSSSTHIEGMIHERTQCFDDVD